MGIISSAINFVDSRWQHQENKSFWYEQQAYNTPANQVKRLEDAGLNPALMLGNIQSGQGASMTPVRPGPAVGITDSLLNMMKGKKERDVLDAQAKKLENDATLSEIDGWTRLAKNLQELKESMSREDKNKANIIQGDILANAQDMVARAQVGHYAAQTEESWMRYASGMTELQYLPQKLALDWVQGIANILMTHAQTEKFNKEAEYLIEKKTAEMFGWKGQKFVNSLNEDVREYLIDKHRTDVWRGINPTHVVPLMLNEGRHVIKEWFGD